MAIVFDLMNRPILETQKNTIKKINGSIIAYFENHSIKNLHHKEIAKLSGNQILNAFTNERIAVISENRILNINNQTIGKVIGKNTSENAAIAAAFIMCQF